MTVFTKTGSAAWTKINSIFVKTGSTTWTELLGAWVKTGSTTWTRVFTRILVPANTVPPDVTGSTKLYGTLTGSLGSWTSPNGTNSYARQWQRASNINGVAGAFSAISGATSSTYTTTDSDDNKFVCVRVTATNLSGSTTAQSYEYLITKYTPVALSTYSLSGVAIVGGTLTAFEQIGTWKGTTTITGDTSPSTFEYEWSYSDGTIRQSTAFNSTNSNAYTIVPGDLGKVIRVRVTGTNSGGSDTTGYTSSGTVTSTYAFSFGNTLYVGSNGYIGLDSGGSTAASPGSGRIINIYSNDLVQYRLQEYSDSSNYYLYFRSYNYQSPLVRAAANAVDYQIKFYTGQPYCDIYIARKGSSVPIQTEGPGYYSSGFTGYAGIPGPYAWGAGSVLRSYFNGATGSQSAFTWTPIADTLWKNISSSEIDDSFTSVVTSANQQAPVLSAPTLNSVSVSDTGGSVSANFTGGSGPFYQMFWWGTATAPTTAVTPDATRSFSPLIDPTGPSSTATQYMYVRSVQTETDTSVGPSSVASAWSNGIAFNMTTPPVIPTITMGGNTGISPSAGTINWTSTNQASFSSTGTFSATGTTGTSISKTGLSALTTYTGTVTVTSSTGHTASANYSITTTDSAVIPTITMAANSGVSASTGTINWTSTNQASFSATGTFSGTGTTGTSISKTGLTASTTYTGTVTVTSSTNNTASANYSLTTSAAPAPATFTIGTVSASKTATRQITGTWTSTRSGGTFQWWNTRIRNTSSGATAKHSLYSETPKSDIYTSLTGTSYRFGVQGVSYDSNYSVYRYTVGSSDEGAYTENSTNVNPA